MEGQAIEKSVKKIGIEGEAAKQDIIAEGANKPEKTKEEKQREQQIEKNRRALQTLSAHIGEYLDFFYKRFPENRQDGDQNLGLLAWRHQPEYNYPKAACANIEKIFSTLPEIVSDMVEDPEINFQVENHLKHILGNSPKALAFWADKRASDILLKGGDLNDPNNDTLVKIRNYKKIMDSVLAYLALIEERSDILKKEMSKEDGWFEELAPFYKGKIPDNTSGWSEVILLHYNFFARVQGWKPKLNNLRMLASLTTSIDTKDDFEAAFNALPQHEILDKEKIFKEFLETRQVPQEKAA